MKKKTRGDEEMAPLVKCLPYKHKALCSILEIHIGGKPGMMACTYNPGSGEVRAGRPWGLLATSRPIRNPVSKNKVGGA